MTIANYRAHWVTEALNEAAAAGLIVWPVRVVADMRRPARGSKRQPEAIAPSADGGVYTRVHQLRDPVFYAGGGEDAICGARLRL